MEQLVRSAALIFSGKVISVGGTPSSPSAAAPQSTVMFRVEHALRGTFAGETLTIREWAALTVKGEHYHVGEQALLFLYRPSKLGLTSPVAGSLGRFAVNSAGYVVLSPLHQRAFAGDPKIGGKETVSYSDFARAVRQTFETE